MKSNNKKDYSLEKIIRTLKKYWSKYNCVPLPSFDQEVGAGTLSPYTAIHAMNDRPISVCYTQICSRPNDSTFGEGINRLSSYYQFQVLLKPSRKFSNIQELFLCSLAEIGINLKDNDVQFIEDDWKNESIGAYGLGYEVWLNGTEIAQFTYMQSIGGIDCPIPSCELTYGIERIAMFLQQKESIYEITYSQNSDKNISYEEMHPKEEEFSRSAYTKEYFDDEKFLRDSMNYNLEMYQDLVLEKTRNTIILTAHQSDLNKNLYCLKKFVKTDFNGDPISKEFILFNQNLSKKQIDKIELQIKGTNSSQYNNIVKSLFSTNNAKLNSHNSENHLINIDFKNIKITYFCKDNAIEKIDINSSTEKEVKLEISNKSQLGQASQASQASEASEVNKKNIYLKNIKINFFKAIKTHEDKLQNNKFIDLNEFGTTINEMSFFVNNHDCLQTDINKEVKDSLEFKAELTTLEGVLQKPKLFTAYRKCLQASHMFSILEARGVLSKQERRSLILKIKHFAGLCVKAQIRLNKAK